MADQALSGKLETVLELACPPGKFLKAWKSEAHQIPKHTPNNIHSVELHEGDWDYDKGSSIKFWEYSVGGKRETVKERMEVDEAKNIIKLTGLEGDVMKIYKVFNTTFKLAPKGQGTLATLMIEYEKVKEDVPNPDIYMDLMISLTKDIAAAVATAQALSGKLETVLELDCPPGKFVKAWKSEAHQIPKHTPDHIHSVELHEGDWEHDKGTSIKFWEYSIGGKRETFKERVEVDEANNIVKLTGLEGDPMKIYKVLDPIYKLEPKGEGRSLATLALEYEKVNEDVPNPDIYIDFMVKISKDIAAAVGKA